jgi:hypothetical protein
VGGVAGDPAGGAFVIEGAVQSCGATAGRPGVTGEGFDPGGIVGGG